MIATALRAGLIGTASRMVPGSLAGRAWLAFIVAWILSFSLVGLLGLHAQIQRLTDAKYQSALVTLELLTETVVDSAIIEDYDTIRRVLLKAVLQPSFAKLEFLGAQGAAVDATPARAARRHTRLGDWIAARYALPFEELSRSVVVGGRDYGTLRLTFDRDYMHEYVAWILQLGLGALFLGLLFGVVLVFLPLQRWMKGVVARQDSASGASLLNTTDREAVLAAAPSEFRPLIAKLFDTSMSLGAELDKRERALVMLRHTVSESAGVLRARAGSDDEVEALLIATRNIMQDRAQALQRLEQALQDAMIAGKAKDDFLASISHELRTPLNAVIGLSEMIELPGANLADRQRLEVIRSAGRQLLAIINDLLDFSAIRSGYFQLRPEPVAIRDIVDEVTAIARIGADPDRVELASTLQVDLPRRVICDGARLSQILLNLMTNAVKFTPVGSVRLEVRAVAAGPDSACPLVEFRVIDTGPGIAPADRGVIFETFGQGREGRALRKPGTGLGLSISRVLAEKMSGTLELDAAHAPGACFVLRLPLQPAPAASADVTDDRAARAIPARLRVLVAEDTPASQLVMKAMLDRLRAHFRVVEDGLGAVQACTGEAWDIAVLDLQMPRMDGFEAARRIRATRPGVKLIALSAFAEDSHRDLAIASGFDVYLIKPVRFAGLSDAIASCIGAPDRQIAPAHAAPCPLP